MRETSLKRTFLFYGIFLILVGVAGYLSNPEKAKTALMSGGTFGLISIALSFAMTKFFTLARGAGLVVTLMLAGVFTWRSHASWTAYFGGQPEKWFAATLISSMLVASIVVLFKIFQSFKQPKSLESQTSGA